MFKGDLLSLFRLHPSYYASMRRMAAFLLLLAGIQLLAWLLPTWSDFKGVPYYLPLHELLETASIIVSMMVFAVGWNSRSANLSGNVVLLASVFFSVAGLDFLHTISYVGMPDYISHNDSQKHLNFWLSARLFAALVLLFVAIRPWKPLSSTAERYLVFGMFLATTLIINWAVVYHQSWFPDTFIPGQGLTPFKKDVEYMIIVVNVLTAAMLWTKMRARQTFNVVLLFGTVLTLAMSEFFFTLYSTMIGSYNVLGHIYKVIAYMLIYRAIVVEVIEEPYFQLKEAEGQLRGSQQLLDSIIENIPNMIFLKRASDLRFELFNRAGEALLGYGRSQLLGKNDYDFFPREQADSFINKDRAVLAQQESIDIQEETITTAHGVRILHTKKLPLNDAQGQPQYLLGISEDITERKQEEAEIRALKDDLEIRVKERTLQLEAANKELEAFTYSVSHDLRSPLRAIDGFSHILLDDYADKLDDEGKRILNVVRDNTIRMGKLIDDLLKFSRSSRLEMTFSEINMENLAREVVAELQPSINDGKLQVEIGPIPSAKGDRAMMHQVFVNLLSNAIKFSGHREIAMIKVGGSIEGGEAVYFVKDNGAGFDMQYADKLFGVFQRLHSMSEFEGTGIGLAIVKRIITRHGGRVWAEGKVNEGATMNFTLPIKRIAHE